MSTKHVNPTRMELTRLKKKLTTAMRGYKLLKDKRDELMRQFLELVRENKALREKVEAGIREANQNFVLARAGMSQEALNVALMAPKQEVYLEAETRNVMSVEIAKNVRASCTPLPGTCAAVARKTRETVFAITHSPCTRSKD